MIISWMIFATVIGLLLTGAALAAERLAIALKFPTRPVWGVALVMTIVWPIAASLMVALAGSVHAGATIPRSGTAPMVHTLTYLQALALRMPTVDVGHTLGRGFLVMWGLSSLVLMGRLLWSMWRLYRLRHTWQRAELDGVAVRLSSDIGPAVVGFRAMDVVLPEWVLAFDTPLRTLILRHEEEHRSAGDPLLLLLATLVVALVPWNGALWWQSRRLRLAIEVDCDGRVLAAHPQPGRYGLLLLALAQRRTNTPTQCAPALMESTSHLERRIIAMRNRTLSISSLRMLMIGVVAISAIALACGVESPTRPSAENQTTKLSVSSGRKSELIGYVGVRVPDSLPQHASGQTRVKLRAPREELRADARNTGDPVLIVDGKRANPSIDQINPNSIKTIDVFKGPSASALYGADAARGVIVITTKK